MIRLKTTIKAIYNICLKNKVTCDTLVREVLNNE